MKNRIVILLVFSSLYGCRNYESDKYIIVENEAINDIIHQLIDYETIVKNHLDTNHLKLFLISPLYVKGFDTYEIPCFSEYVDRSGLTDSEVKEYKEDYGKIYKRLKEEQKDFAPLIKGKFKERTLDYKFEYPNLQVELISEKYLFNELKQNEMGYLSISRIIFNRSFDKGYLSYGVYCGEGCFWENNIEIIKINGKWKISKYFSGGIA